MKRTIKIAMTFLLTLAFINCYCQHTIVEHTSILSDDRTYIDPIYKGDTLFENEIISNFKNELGKVKFLGCEVYINKIGVPTKVEFLGQIGKTKNVQYVNMTKKIEKYILEKCRWRMPFKNTKKKKVVIGKSIYFTLKDDL